MDEIEMKDSYYINGRIFETENIESGFEFAYLNFRDGIDIDNVSKSYQTIYNHLSSNIENLWSNIDNKNMTDILIELANEIKRFVDKLGNAIDNYENKYYPTVFYSIEGDVTNENEYNFEDSEFEHLKKQSKLVWENVENIPIGLYYDGDKSIIVHYPKQNNPEKTSELSKVYDICDVEYFAYQIEKEIYTEYSNLLAINKSIWEQAEKLYQIMEFKEIDIKQPEPKKEKTTNPKPFIPKLELKGNWKEFMKLFFAKEVTDKYDNPLMDENEVEQFIKQNFDEDYKGEFKTFDPKCNQSVYSEFASRFQYFISEKQNSWKLASILINNFKTFHTTHLWKTEFINDEPSKELKGFIKSLPSVSGNYFDYRKYFNADGILIDYKKHFNADGTLKR
jgi:hypothetical protein